MSLKNSVKRHHNDVKETTRMMLDVQNLDKKQSGASFHPVTIVTWFTNPQEHENTITNDGSFRTERARKTPERIPGKIPGRV
jgi:hypothetical protein